MHVEENKVVKCVTPRKKRLDCNMSEGVFRCKFFLDFNTIALSFVFDKYCPIID